MKKKPSTIKKSHGQIATALKNEAKARGENPNDVYNQFFRETFLHALMNKQSGWVLKGGSNIYCRIPGARQTKDLDFYRQHEPTSSVGAAEALVAQMNGHREGPYTFRVFRSPRAAAQGTVDSQRIIVKVVHGVNNQLIEFGVDVSGDLEVTGHEERLVVEKTYEVQTEFLPSRFQISSYPIANQIADKVCAMYERHGDTPPGKASTRYRDLYDIALMARELSVTAIDLRIALRRQCEVRKLTLPERIALPDENWKTRYPITVQKLGGKYADLTSIDLALQIAGLLVDPILCGEIGTENLTWDYSSLQWA